MKDTDMEGKVQNTNEILNTKNLGQEETIATKENFDKKERKVHERKLGYKGKLVH